MLLADTPPNRLSYGEISNHCKQITSARRTWKIYVLGGGSCMTIRGFERWGTLCFPPCPSQLRKCAAIGQLSCRDACRAYRSVTNQTGALQQEHLSLFSLLSLARTTRGDWSTNNTVQISLPLLPWIYLWFFSSSPFKPDKNVHFLLNVELFWQIFCVLRSTDVGLYFTFNWTQFLVHDPALVILASA